MTTTPALTGAERTAAKIGYLSKTDLFQDLTPPELAEIERKITMHTCERGRVFYLPGETGEVLFILKEGASSSIASLRKVANSCSLSWSRARSSGKCP